MTDVSPSKYLQLADDLRQELRSGRHAAGAHVATEHDLVRNRGVSRVTVRKAVDVLIGEGLLERRAGKGLFARQPATAQAAVIQVVCGNLAWAPCLDATRAIQEEARKQHLQVQLYDAHGRMAEDLDAIRNLPDGPARGAVVFGLHSPAFAEAVYALKARAYPVVLIDQRLGDLEVPSVVADNHGGGLLLGRLLAARGHRRIAFLGDLDAHTVRERLDGLRDAIADAGLPFDRALVRDVSQHERLAAVNPAVAAAVRELMALERPPTAIFASCDAFARDACAALRALGRRVPAEVSVVGFDDDPLAALHDPPLTSVRQPFAEMGRAAFAALLARLQDPTAPVAHQRVAVSLVERASVAAPAGC